MDFTLIPAKLLLSLQRAQTLNTIGEPKCKQKDVNSENKEILTIKSELKMLTEKSHLYVIHSDLGGYTSPVKNGLSLSRHVRNKQCLQNSGRLLLSSHKNRASPCQWPF